MLTFRPPVELPCFRSRPELMNRHAPAAGRSWPHARRFRTFLRWLTAGERAGREFSKREFVSVCLGSQLFASTVDRNGVSFVGKTVVCRERLGDLLKNCFLRLIL